MMIFLAWMLVVSSSTLSVTAGASRKTLGLAENSASHVTLQTMPGVRDNTAAVPDNTTSGATHTVRAYPSMTTSMALETSPLSTLRHRFAAPAASSSAPVEANITTADDSLQRKAIMIPAIFMFVDIALPVLGLIAGYFWVRRKQAFAVPGSSVSDAAPVLPDPISRHSHISLPLGRPAATDLLGRHSSGEVVQPNMIAVEKPDPLELGLQDKDEQVVHKASSLGFGSKVASLFKTDRSTSKKEADLITRNITLYASLPVRECLDSLETSSRGLSPGAAAQRLKHHGANQLSHLAPPPWFVRLFWCLVQPFNMVLLVLASLSVAPLPDPDYVNAGFMMMMVLLSTTLRFIQEQRSSLAAQHLCQQVRNTATVVRDGGEEEIDTTLLVPGDLIRLSAGDIIPADLRLISSRDLFIAESSLTGECMPVEKVAQMSTAAVGIMEHTSICFMGTSVISGTATALVIATGDSTLVASMAATLASTKPPNAFDIGVRRVSYCLITFMVCMVPVVVALSGVSTGSWLGTNGAISFGLSVAVGLIPEMLPMVVTANLCCGALAMSKKKNIVRHMDSIPNLGAMDVLCTDKTGTLTLDKVTLVSYWSPLNAEPCLPVLKYAYCNSAFQTGLKNLLDKGVCAEAESQGLTGELDNWEKIDELPFDFERRRLSVVLQRREGNKEERRPLLICKGAIEEILAHSGHAFIDGQVVVMDDAMRCTLIAKTQELNSKGLRVLGVATRTFAKPLVEITHHETDMCFQGFLAFLDPLKPTASKAIEDLNARSVEVKVLTGDNLEVAKYICQQLGLSVAACATGAQIEAADDVEVVDVALRCSLFAKLSPAQKLRIVQALKRADKIVGFLGDGTNDCLALHAADVGVSVDSGTDAAKQAADMVLLEKDLNILGAAVEQGRKTQANTIKYICMAVSSNFGNVFSVVAASAWLPYNPMTNKQILALNLLYDISQTALPWDNVDSSYVAVPRRWSAKNIARFMLIIGPLSSIFDVVTFLINWYHYGYINADDKAAVARAQTGWFIESLLTQSLVVHMLRTEHIPLIQSRASWQVMASTFGMMALGNALPYIPKIGKNGFLDMAAVHPHFYGFVIVIVVAYCLLVQLFKGGYKKVFSDWL